LTINRKKARTKSSLQGERNKPDELEEFLLAKVILQIKDLLKNDLEEHSNLFETHPSPSNKGNDHHKAINKGDDHHAATQN